MSESRQPGLHPAPDSLNAFIEGVLPEHERLQCLAHLAECPSCREVVYLAQYPLESEPLAVAPAIEKVSFWKRWFTPAYALSAAAAGVLVLSFALYQHYKSKPIAPEMVAMATHPAEPASPPEPVHQPLQPLEKTTARALISAAPAREKSIGQNMLQQPAAEPVARQAVAAPVAAPTAAAPGAAPRAAAPAAAVAAPQPLAAFDASDFANKDVLPGAQTGVAGTITDPAGSAVAGAAVKLRPLTSPASRNLTSDPKGQFNVAGLEPGRYEVQVIAPGFKTMTQQVDIQPNQIARADSTLSLGSVAESVSVTAEVAQVQVSSGAAAGGRGGRGGGGGGRGGVQPLPATPSVTFSTLANTPGISLDGVTEAGVNGAGVNGAKIDAANQQPVLMLPNKLPARMTAASGKLMLAADSTGALFLSQDAGKKWKTVKPVWHGNVASLAALPTHAPPKGPSFQLTTDSGSVWLSRDGSHWYAAPSPK